MEAVKCQGLTKRYGTTLALDNLDLNIPSGVIFGFLGPNGAGKTTLLKILSGLMRPTGGKAWVVGHDVQPNSAPLQHSIGYLPEEPAFYPWMTAREYLVFVARVFSLSASEAGKRADELLDTVDLVDAASRRIGGFSRGMKQRLGIAQALVNRPSVLFLDEPSSALDPIGRMKVLETLLRLKEQSTIFLSSHILGDVERVCDRVGIVDKSRLITDATVDELRSRYTHHTFEMHIEEPDTAALQTTLKALPWVEKIDAGQSDKASRLLVQARDLDVAKKRLPGLITASGLTLLSYQMVSPTLEEVFVQILDREKKPLTLSLSKGLAVQNEGRETEMIKEQSE